MSRLFQLDDARTMVTDRDFRSAIPHLAIVTAGYPSPANPTRATFVREFARGVARAGVQSTVINPVAVQSVMRNRAGYPLREVDTEVGEGHTLTVLRPRFVSLSARAAFAKLGPVNPSLLTFREFTRAVLHAVRYEGLAPAAIYGHFLFMAGAAAVRVGTKLGIPAFPGVGEGELWTLRPYGLERARRELRGATGFVVNSTPGRQMVADALGVPESRMAVFPNGVDLARFKPRDPNHCRERFDLPKDLFLVCSVGNFLEKKGVARVAQAVDGLEGVGGVYAGSGPVPPVASNTVLCRRVSHEDMPYLLAACDVFVLPTAIEGSSSAIVEAMACGLPVISSTGRFNDDLLEGITSIRVAPRDVSAIRRAIVNVKNDSGVREAMARSSLSRGGSLGIDRRARDVLDYMSQLRSEKGGLEP